MKHKKYYTFVSVMLLQLAITVNLFATEIPDSIAEQKSYFYSAKQEINDMLAGKAPLSYERAIFVMENAYRNNSLSYRDFQATITHHIKNIKLLEGVNKNESTQNFKATLFESEEAKKEIYNKALNNYAIYTYITDTTFSYRTDTVSGINKLVYHTPYQYSAEDPLASDNWKNSQVLNLLNLYTRQGNCFALASLFKIFSERLNSEANICTAPGHIYIRHADTKGIYYNVELASRVFPGTGSIETLTYTTDEATKNGIALRELNLKQSVGLCLINLAKGFEHKFKTKDSDFMMQCAELTLRYDSLNLNAMLLKAEVLEQKLILKNKTIAQLRTDKEFKAYEKLVSNLYKLGYREMPLEMKNIIVSALKKDGTPIITKDHTPQPYKDLGIKDKHYATLSSGLFDEMHEEKPFEQYNRTVFDTKKKKITKFTNVELLYNKYNFDPVVFAWNVDPKTGNYPHMSPYAAFENNPIYFNDPTGGDADVTIVGNTIYVTAKIKIYGSGASEAKATEIQNDIMGKWGGNHPYTDSKGNVYNVKFSANVTTVPFADPYTAGATDNFIEVADVDRSYVSGGNKGVWSTNPRGGKGTYAHEYGHLIGLTDGYIDNWVQTAVQGSYNLKSNVGENYSPNDIMADHTKVVTPSDVKAVAAYVLQSVQNVQVPFAATGQIKFGGSPLGPGLTANDLLNANPPPIPDGNKKDKTLQYNNGGSSQPEAATRGEARSEYKFDGE